MSEFRHPTWWALLLTVAGALLFMRLGVWQLHRADYKEALLRRYAASSFVPLQGFATVAGTPPADSFPRVTAHDRYLADRRYLLLIALVFAVPVIVAGLLVFGGWQPIGKANGQPILPQRNFVAEKLRVQLADGQPYPWRDSKPRMTLIALAGLDCAVHCLAALTGMAEGRVILNRNPSRLRLLYLGTSPADAAERMAMVNYWQLGDDGDGKLAGYRPAAPDSVSAVLVESDGTALSRYPAGLDVAGLLRDLQKVIP